MLLPVLPSARPSRCAAASLRYAAAAAHPRTALKRLTQCRTVLRRLRVVADLYAVPAVEDARGHYARVQPPPRQEEPITFPELHAWTRVQPPPVRHSLRLLFAAAARPSDFLGSESRRAVRVAEAAVDADGVVHILYRRTKSDVEGVGRRVAFLPTPSTVRWVRERLTLPAETPLLPVTFARLRAAMPPGFALRSLRRGAIRAALLGGASVRSVQALSGHADRRTVFRYAGLIAPEQRRRGMAASMAAIAFGAQAAPAAAAIARFAPG